MSAVFNNFSVLSKTVIFSAGIYGAIKGSGARATNQQLWDNHALILTKREVDAREYFSGKKETTGSEGPSELAPGVPMPEELKEVVSALNA